VCECSVWLPVVGGGTDTAVAPFLFPACACRRVHIVNTANAANTVNTANAANTVNVYHGHCDTGQVVPRSNMRWQQCHQLLPNAR